MEQDTGISPSNRLKNFVKILILSCFTSFILCLLLYDDKLEQNLHHPIKTRHVIRDIIIDYDYQGFTNEILPQCHDNSSLISYLMTLRPSSVAISECSAIWIKNDSLDIKGKIKLFNEMLDLATKFAYKREKTRNIPRRKKLFRRFHDNTQQIGGMLRTQRVFKMVERNNYITTVYISPNKNHTSVPNQSSGRNILSDDLIKEYFTCTASGDVLDWTRARIKAPPICSSDLNTLSKSSRYMDTRFYSYHGWKHYFVPRKSGYGRRSSFSSDWNINCKDCNNTPKAVTYAHIIRHAVLVDPSVVFQMDTKLRIAPLQGGKKNKPFPTKQSFRELLSRDAECTDKARRNIVFSIGNNFQGTDERWNFYHSFGESTSKLSIYLKFLRANPKISIHVRGKIAKKLTQQFIKRYLNLTNEVVSGTVFTKVLILPEGNPCFSPGYLYLQYIREILTRNMNLHFKNGKYPNSILYIQRTEYRVLSEEKPIMKHLERLAHLYNLEFNIFIDAEEISMLETANKFHNSLLTVGAHGAGLTNIIFALPRTAVFDIVCEVSPVTFMQMSHKLGLRYHAFYGNRASKKRCDDGMSIEDMFNDFKIKTEEILKIVLNDFRNI